MLIDDPGLFSVVIPNFQGAPFLRRALDYLKREVYRGRVVICDSSTGADRDFARSCHERYPELLIEVFDYPETATFTGKLIDTLQRISSQSVLLHANDDFMVPAAVEDCLSFLRDNADFSASRGRVAVIHLERKPSAENPGGIEAGISTNPMRGYLETDPVERVIGHLSRYSSTFYSVHRRKDIVAALARSESTQNVIFFQYLSSCALAFHGRIWCSDRLFYVRQDHARSWSATLKKASYEHWPLLMVSRDFSRLYGEFKAALLELLDTASGDAQETERRIDEAALSLFRRSFCGVEVDNPGERAFIDRLNDPASSEHALLREVIGFAAQYPDTF